MENELLIELKDYVIAYNENMIKNENMKSIIDQINTHLKDRARSGYTKYHIQFTDNDQCKTGDHGSTFVIFVPNDILRNMYSNYIKDYYEHQHLIAWNRHNSNNDVLISWDRQVLDKY